MSNSIIGHDKDLLPHPAGHKHFWTKPCLTEQLSIPDEKAFWHFFSCGTYLCIDFLGLPSMWNCRGLSPRGFISVFPSEIRITISPSSFPSNEGSLRPKREGKSASLSHTPGNSYSDRKPIHLSRRPFKSFLKSILKRLMVGNVYKWFRRKKINSKFPQCKDYCQRFSLKGCILPLGTVHCLNSVLYRMCLSICMFLRWHCSNCYWWCLGFNNERNIKYK